MRVEGTIQNGTVVLDQPTTLPEGTRVAVTIEEESKPLSLLERFKDIVGIAEGLPEDAATNVDHYLYGHPKR